MRKTEVNVNKASENGSFINQISEFDQMMLDILMDMIERRVREELAAKEVDDSSIK